MYNEIVMDHFTNPRNVGEIADADGVGETGSFKCGDTMTLYIKVENEIIVDAKFQTFGCGAAIASSSMLTEMVKGMSIDEAMRLTNQDVADRLGGLPPLKLHCSNLAADALHNAIENYRRRRAAAS